MNGQHWSMNVRFIYLSVDEYDRAEQPPCATLAIDVEHAQDL